MKGSSKAQYLVYLITEITLLLFYTLHLLRFDIEAAVAFVFLYACRKTAKSGY
jgi:hypothetical protein